MNNDFLNLDTATANSVSITVGKKYLFNIIDELVEDESLKEGCYIEIDNFIASIENSEKINSFTLNEDLLEFIQDNNKIKSEDEKFSTSLDRLDNEFSYTCLFYHFEYYYSYFLEDKKRNKMHLCFSFKPTESTVRKNLDDSLPIYNSFICKFQQSKYIKYVANRDNVYGWNYLVSMVYLIILNYLYLIINPLDLWEFFDTFFRNLNPVVTGLCFTTEYNCSKNEPFDIIREFYRLKSSDERRLLIHINPKNTQVKFNFSMMDGIFSNTLNLNDLKPKYIHDNKGKRLVKLIATKKDNKLVFKISIIGMNALRDLTQMEATKELYSYISSNCFLDSLAFKVLSNMLSLTQQHQKLKKYLERKVEQSNFRTIYSDKNSSFEKKELTRGLVQINAFKNITSINTLEIAKALVSKFKLERYAMSYIITVIELYQKTDKEISSLIKKFPPKQQAKIRKMIVFARNFQQKRHYLNDIYRKVNYRDLC